MTTAVREAPHHNTLTCVKHYGCKRIECRDRLNAYYRAWRQKRSTQPPLIDAEPVRQHLALLAEARIGPRRVATITGLAVETVAGFTRPYSAHGTRFGRKHKVRPDVAAKILALNPDETTPGVTDATGSRRRVQALNAAGWPTALLRDRLPEGRSTILTIHKQTHLYARTADSIAALYDELKDQRPEEHGVHPTSAHRAWLRAQRNNWPDTAYWAGRMDVIDDPHFTPEYGLTRRQIVAQDARWLMQTNGLDKRTAAERLGVSKSYVEHALAAHPQTGQELAA